MSTIILVTGGSRSGKSAHALRLAESRPGPWTFVATCPAIDEEMARKIEVHKQERDARTWTTVEEEIDLAGAVERAGAFMNAQNNITSGKAGVQRNSPCPRTVDSGFRRDDENVPIPKVARTSTLSGAGAGIGDSADMRTAAGVILVDCLTLWINNLMYRASLAWREVTEQEVAGLTDAVVRAARSAPGTVIFVTNEVGLGIVPPDASTRLYRNLVGRCGQAIAAAANAAVMVVCGMPITLKGDPGT